MEHEFPFWQTERENRTNFSDVPLLPQNFPVK